MILTVQTIVCAVFLCHEIDVSAARCGAVAFQSAQRADTLRVFFCRRAGLVFALRVRRARPLNLPWWKVRGGAPPQWRRRTTSGFPPKEVSGTAKPSGIRLLFAPGGRNSHRTTFLTFLVSARKARYNEHSTPPCPEEGGYRQNGIENLLRDGTQGN